MKKRVADIVMEILLEHNITDCFAVVGGGAMHLNNALLVYDEIHKYFNHHEQACAMAADAYARYCGKMAAVCVTSGPGSTNALTGVMGAWQDSLPMIILSGQVRYEISVAKSGLPLRYRGIQEFEIVPTVKNMTKYATMIIDPLSIRREMRKAIAIAMEGRRGPVWLDIPQDIQNAMVDEKDLYEDEIIDNTKYQISLEDMEEISQLIKVAKRPCILAGSGIISGNVMEEFEIFVERLGVPVVGGSYVVDNVCTENILHYGGSGIVGPRVGNFILQNADVILVLGNSLGFRQTGFVVEKFAPNSKIIMVDADEFESQKPGLHIYKKILTTLDLFFEKTLLEKWISDVKWINYCNNLRKKFTSFEAIKDIDMKDRVCSYYFWKIFQQYEDDESILVLGCSTSNTAKLQIGKTKKTQRVLLNYVCGSMGCDLPGSIGGAVASGKKVLCITGDGNIMMNLQELQTITHYNLPINIVIFANDGYGAIRQTSKNFFNGAYIGCTPDTGLSIPDFKKIANTFDFEYILCRTNEELEECIIRMNNCDNRVILEILEKLDDPVLPKLMSRIDENGIMQTPELHDMYPFLEKDEIDQYMMKINTTI